MHCNAFAERGHCDSPVLYVLLLVPEVSKLMITSGSVRWCNCLLQLAHLRGPANAGDTSKYHRGLVSEQ